MLAHSTTPNTAPEIPLAIFDGISSRGEGIYDNDGNPLGSDYRYITKVVAKNLGYHRERQSYKTRRIPVIHGNSHGTASALSASSLPFPQTQLPYRPLHAIQPVPLQHHHLLRQRLDRSLAQLHMQFLPPSQLSRNRLLRISQLAPQLPQFVFAALSFGCRLSMDALAGFVEKAKRPAIGAAEGGVVLAKGIGGGLHLGDEGLWTGEGGKDGKIGGRDGGDVGIEGLEGVAFGGAVCGYKACKSREMRGREER